MASFSTGSSEVSLPTGLAGVVSTVVCDRELQNSRAERSTVANGLRNAEELEKERSLIEKAHAGDTTAFGQLYEQHAAKVYRLAIAPVIRDRAIGEDLLADTFVKAFENLFRFRWQGRGMLPWLVRIAKNISLDYLRRGKRQVEWPTDLEQNLLDPNGSDAEECLGELEVSELLRTQISHCLESINPRYASVLRLRLIEHMPRAEAAQRLGVSVGTLDVLLFRACQAFRRVYKQWWTNTTASGTMEFTNR